MRNLAYIVLIVVVVTETGWAADAAYPSKPIRLVVSETGGAGDFAGRLIALGMVPSLGQQVIVDNRPGAFTSGRVVATATPDGYTLLLTGSNMWLQPFMRSHVPFDPIKDFSPITLATTSPLVVVVHPSVAASSVKELIALAKAKPGVLNYGSGNVGSSSHLGVELFKSMAGVDIVRIPYKGVGYALIALVAGESQIMIASAGSAMSHVKSGRLRALASTGAKPSALLPELPTMAASGLPGYEVAGMTGIYAPVKTPRAIINRLNQEIVRFLNRADVKERFLNAEVEIVVGSPEQFAAMIKAEVAKWDKVIKDAGINLD